MDTVDEIHLEVSKSLKIRPLWNGAGYAFHPSRWVDYP